VYGGVIVAAGVLSEVPVTVGVPEAVHPSARGVSQCLAFILTISEVEGLAYVSVVGSLANKNSCLGIETGGGVSPESRTEDYPIRFFVS